MQVEPLGIQGAWVFTPQVHGDDRDDILKWYKSSAFADGAGHPLNLAEARSSVSDRGVVRGIHYAEALPGQVNYVNCVAGAVREVVVDLRVGSPTFGQWEAVVLDAVDRRALYLSTGLGHGFCSLQDGSTVLCLCSHERGPAIEHVIHPLDPELGIDWGVDAAEIRLSVKDAAAPTLAAALAEDPLRPRGGRPAHPTDLHERLALAGLLRISEESFELAESCETWELRALEADQLAISLETINAQLRVKLDEGAAALDQIEQEKRDLRERLKASGMALSAEEQQNATLRRDMGSQAARLSAQAQHLEALLNHPTRRQAAKAALMSVGIPRATIERTARRLRRERR